MSRRIADTLALVVLALGAGTIVALEVIGYLWSH